MSKELPQLYIPSEQRSPSKATARDKICIAQRRNQKSEWPRSYFGLKVRASDATAWSPGGIPNLNKPLPFLPDETISSAGGIELPNSRRSSECQKRSRSSDLPLNAIFGCMARVIRIRRKASKSGLAINTPGRYVDKGTQTSFENLPSTARTKRASAGGNSDKSALRSYHASVQVAHEAVSRKQSSRPDIRSLQSFLQNTSPSSPGTPTPGIISGTTSSSQRSGSISPKTLPPHSPSSAMLEPLFDTPQPSNMSLLQPRSVYAPTIGGRSTSTASIYDSKYSQSMTSNLNKLPGASAPNTGLDLSSRSISPMDTVTSRPLLEKRAITDSVLAAQDAPQSPLSHAR